MAVVLGSGEPEGHGRALLRLLDEQRKEGRFCDVMVQVGRARFAAHRCILAACSPFLCQKLDATSSDATPEVLHLDMLQADAFAAVLQFLYTAQADNKEALANGAHALDVALPVPADPPAMSELESPVSLTPCITAVPSPISPSLCRSRYPYSISERINRVGGANSRCRVRRRPARVGWFEQHGDADDGSGSSDNVEDNVAIGQTTTLADFPSCGSPENCSETEIAAEIAEALTSTGSLCHITCSPAAAAAGDSSSDQDASDVFGICSIPIVEQEDEPGLSTILKDGLISGHLALPSLLSPENTAGKEKRAFACSCCGKRFPRASDLRKHERSHSDERPFACPLCRRAFKHRSHLNDHERRHRGLRPFPCTFCPKAFAKASDLKRHQNTMHGTRTATGISISRRISLVEPLLHQIVGT